MLSQFIKAQVAFGAYASMDDYLNSPSKIKTTMDQQQIQQGEFLHYDSYMSSAKQGSDTNGNYLSPNGAMTFHNPSGTSAKPYNQTSGKTVSVYYTEWAVWKNMALNTNHTGWGTNILTNPQFPDTFQPEAVTHLQFGFIPICGSKDDGTDLQLALCTVNPCVPGKDKTPLQNLKIACGGAHEYEVVVFDSWGDFAFPATYYALFYALEETKRAYKDLKIIGSIGGWTLSKPFYFINDDTKIETFTNSVAKFAVDFQFFDGFDLDYEVPGGVGGADDGVSEVTYQDYDDAGENAVGGLVTTKVPLVGNVDEDKKNYVKIVKTLREKLTKIGKGLNKTYELTIATNCDPVKMANTNFTDMHQYLDAINMMTYDFSGAWTNGASNDRASYITNHTNLYNREDGKDMSSVEQAYKVLVEDQKVPTEKLALGVALYGRGWTGIGREAGADDAKSVTFKDDTNKEATAKDWFDSFTIATGGCKGVVQDGVIDYTSIKEAEASGTCEYYYDECAQAPSLYCSSIDELYTYDNPRSVFAKADFVNKYQMKGLFAWAWDQDDGTLVNAMNEGLGNTPKDGNPVFSGTFPKRPTTCHKGPTTPAPTEKPPVDMTKALKVYGGRCGIAASADDTITCTTDIDPLSFDANDDWVAACAEWFPVLIADATNGYPDNCATAVANFIANHPNGCDCGMSG